jgi:hypothetical protein
LEAVQRLLNEAAPNGVSSQPDTPVLWSSFFQLQASYLLLWSVVERYTALRFGPGKETGERIRQLNQDASFRKAVIAADARPGVVFDSRDQGAYRLAADGSGAAEYFYRVRSNLSHRGKSAFKDGQLVYKATTELLAAMRILLKQQLPTGNGEGRH